MSKPSTERMAVYKKSVSRTKKVNRSKLRTRKIQRGGKEQQPHFKGPNTGTPPKPKKSIFGRIFSRKSRPTIERINTHQNAQKHLDKQRIIEHLMETSTKGTDSRAKRLKQHYQTLTQKTEGTPKAFFSSDIHKLLVKFTPDERKQIAEEAILKQKAQQALPEAKYSSLNSATRTSQSVVNKRESYSELIRPFLPQPSPGNRPVLPNSKEIARSPAQLGAVSTTDPNLGTYISAEEVRAEKQRYKSGSTEMMPQTSGKNPVRYSNLQPGSKDAEIALALAKQGITTRAIIEEEHNINELESMPPPKSQSGFKRRREFRKQEPTSPSNKEQQMAANARAKVKREERQLRPSTPPPAILQSKSKTLGFGNTVRVSVGETYSSNNYNRTPIELSESTTRLARLGPAFSNGIVKKTLETNYFNNNQNNSKLMELIRKEENKEVKKTINSRLHNSYNKLSNKNKETIRHQVMENNNIDYNLFPN